MGGFSLVYYGRGLARIQVKGEAESRHGTGTQAERVAKLVGQVRQDADQVRRQD